MSKTAPPLINPTRSPPYQTLISENEKLKRELKAELLRSEKLQQSLSSTQLQSRRVSQDVHGSRSSPIMTSDTSMRDMELKVRVEELQAELEKKTAMLVEVKRHLKNAAERENTSIVSNSVSVWTSIWRQFISSCMTFQSNAHELRILWTLVLYFE